MGVLFVVGYNSTMSWASRRRTIYLFGVTIFFAVVIGGPVAYMYFSVPSTCTDGIQNQNETAVDKGGSCFTLDGRSLQPHALLWARSFRVRDGSYNAVAYIQNPNKDAGVRQARYRFGFYDAQNILVAEREGTMYILPGATTPVFEAGINAGNRIVAHTYFEFTVPFTWERMKDNALAISINNKGTSDILESPRLTALAKNNSVAPQTNISFVAVMFDPMGNAFAASATSLQRLGAGETTPIVFTWPDPFTIQPNKIDIIPLIAPSLLTAEQY